MTTKMFQRQCYCKECQRNTLYIGHDKPRVLISTAYYCQVCGRKEVMLQGDTWANAPKPVPHAPTPTPASVRMAGAVVGGTVGGLAAVFLWPICLPAAIACAVGACVCVGGASEERN